MLKTLKWVYDLGVRQERVRISAHLQLESQRASISRDTRLDMLRESPKMSKPRRDKLDFTIAVDNKVQEIINSLFESKDGNWIPGSSLMFPNDKHKGEL